MDIPKPLSRLNTLQQGLHIRYPVSITDVGGGKYSAAVVDLPEIHGEGTDLGYVLVELRQRILTKAKLLRATGLDLPPPSKPKPEQTGVYVSAWELTGV